MSDSAFPDLEALRRSEGASSQPRRKRRRGGRWTLVLLVVGVLAALGVVLPPLLLPRREVRIARVQVAEEVTRRARVGAEAAGWIEADPFPVAVRPLVPGVVDSLDVLEGERVVKDETVIATLRNADLENALEVARATLALRESEVEEAEARLHTARSLLEQRLQLRQTLADLEGELARFQRAREAASSAGRRAEAARETARIDLEALEELEARGGSSPLSRRRAAARLAEAEAAVAQARAETQTARAEVARYEALVALAREGVEEPRALEGAVRELERGLARARARRDLARAEVRVAERNVELLTVRAPTDGVVLRLETAPGSAVGPRGEPVGGSEEGTGSTGRLGSSSGALVLLYDPARLQARVDVLLSDVAGIGAGTEAELTVEALPGRSFHGEVIRLQGEADLLKNTLQVKVRILDPDPLLRPEMLVRARFLVKQEEQAEEDRPYRLLVPRQAVRDDRVWVYDPRDGGRARRTTVEVIAEKDGRAEVEADLGPGHFVILDPVHDGEKVKGTQWTR